MSETWQLIFGVCGGGTFVALINWLSRRGNNKAEEVATIVTSAGESVKLSSGLLATYVDEVQKLTRTVSAQATEIQEIKGEVRYLRGTLSQRDTENNWLRARVHLLEEFIHSMNLPIPTLNFDKEPPE